MSDTAKCFTHLNPHGDLVRLGQLLSLFTNEETDLRGQIMCVKDTASEHGASGVL